MASEIPEFEALTNGWPPRRLEKPRRLLPAALQGARPGGWWADLGCGEGVFTGALALLAPDAEGVIAVDRDFHSLVRLRTHFIQAGLTTAKLLPVAADLRRLPLWGGLEGILAANALHFLRPDEQMTLLETCRRLLMPGGRLMVVEYNTARRTGAVPHPLPAEIFLELAERVGFGEFSIAARAPSSYLREMYAGVGRA